mgnify:FL=1
MICRSSVEREVWGEIGGGCVISTKRIIVLTFMLLISILSLFVSLNYDMTEKILRQTAYAVVHVPGAVNIFVDLRNIAAIRDKYGEEMQELLSTIYQDWLSLDEEYPTKNWLQRLKGAIESDILWHPLLKNIQAELLGIVGNFHLLEQVLPIRTTDTYPWHLGWINNGYVSRKEWLSDNSSNLLYELMHLPEIYNKLLRIPQWGLSMQRIDNGSQFNVHNRLEHSFHVAVLWYLIARANGISDSKVLNTIIFSFLLHDIATPQRGDKAMNAIQWLWEEENFESYIRNQESIMKIAEKFWINIEEVASIIKNEWYLGELLDIVDKKAYTRDDVHSFIWGSDGRWDTNEELKKIMNMPNRRTIAQYMRIAWEKVYFDCNPDRVIQLRKVRAYMHQKVYRDINFQTQEKLTGVAIKLLLKQWEITTESLQRWTFTDGHPIEKNHFMKMQFNKEIPADPENITAKIFFNTHSTDITDDISEEDSLRLIYDHYSSLSEREKKYAIVFRASHFKPWLHFSIKHDGEIKPLNEALDDTARNELVELWKSTRKYVLCRPSEKYLWDELQTESYQAFRETLAEEAQESQDKLFQHINQ